MADKNMGWGDFCKRGHDAVVKAEGSSPSKSARSGGIGGMTEVQQQQLDSTSKLSLKNAQQNRMLFGAFVPTYRVPTISEIADSALNASKVYGDLTRGKKGHSFGNRDGYILGAICESISKKMVEGEQRAGVVNMLATNPPGSPGMSALARLVVIEKNFDRGWKRLYIVLAPDQVCLANIIEQAVVAQGGHRQWNAAPPSGLEREIQAIIAERS